jgi:hypothetical protein
MVCLKSEESKSQHQFWYNGTVEPNVGTCIFLEVGQNAEWLEDESCDNSDAELIDFLQDKIPYEVYQQKKEAPQ